MRVTRIFSELKEFGGLIWGVYTPCKAMYIHFTAIIQSSTPVSPWVMFALLTRQNLLPCTPARIIRSPSLCYLS